MKTKRKLKYLPKAIRYLCLAVVFVLGLLSIMATGGGGGGDSSGSSSGTTLISEARVTVFIVGTFTGIPGAQVRGVFLDKDTNLTEEDNCVTDASGRCIVTVAIPGQLADEVTLTVRQTSFNTRTESTPLDSTGSVNVIVSLTPTSAP